ncbi:ABC transporter permease [Nocardia sp. NPDC050793]|uniref:ABC transporter permease n=1 Tax=Nocardia sp. NPDC050793 TaxID=3155159 RepID=UPI0033D95715
MSVIPYTTRDSFTMVRRNLVHARRYPSMTLSILIVPVLILLLFNGVFGKSIAAGLGPDAKYIDYLAPGIFLMAVASGGMVASVAISVDMTKGIVNRFRSMDIFHPSLLVGQATGTVIQTLLSVLAVIGVTLLLGFRPSADAVEWAAAFGLLALLTVALTWVAVALGLVAGNPETASNTPMIIQFLPFISSAFVPTDAMPAGVSQFAKYQPFTPITETLRGLLTGSQIGTHGISAVAWCLGIGVGGYLWAVTAFRRKTRD